MVYCTSMRHYAHMGSRRVRTASYPEEARRRLGDAVAKAREAAGYQYRTEFRRAAGIKSVRSLEMLENGEPGVGQTVLFAVGRLLPGWTEDTPRQILEGGMIPEPAADEESAIPRGKSALDRLLAMTREELIAEAALYDEADPGSGDDWLRRVLAIRQRAQAQTADRDPGVTSKDGS